MTTLARGELKERVLDTQTLESPPRFPCKANCLCDRCNGHLCQDSTCRAAPVHGHPTAPCGEPGAKKEYYETKHSWNSISSQDVRTEYDVEFRTILNAVIACTLDFCPAQERQFHRMIDDAYEYGRMIVWYPECLDWTVDDVVNFIKSLGFSQKYENGFRKNFIDGNKLYLCNSNRLVDMGIRDWKDIRVITKAIRDLLKIGYPKEEAPLKEPRTGVQSLYEFWLRKRAYYALGNERKAKDYCFRKFLDEYGLPSPQVDDFKIFQTAAGTWIERVMAGGRKRRQIRIRELRSAALPAWIENKNKLFLIKGAAPMPQHHYDDDETLAATTPKNLDSDTKNDASKAKLVHFTEKEPENVSPHSAEVEEDLGRETVSMLEEKGENRRDNLESEEEGAEKRSTAGGERERSSKEGEERATSDGDDAPPSVNVIAPE